MEEYQNDALVSLIRQAQGSSALSRRAPVEGSSRPVSAASFYVPTLPAASSSGLQLAPMYSGHLPASYALDAASRDVLPSIPDEAQSDAHLFFVGVDVY